MQSDSVSPLHMIDILRKKRDGGALNEREIQFVATRGGGRVRFPRTSLRRG